ncbi:MAG: hypothetical protein ACO1OK_11615 [Devosia sp.]
MLRRSFTAVPERNVAIADGFVTEPYETAWADEARWFVHVLEAPTGARIAFSAETSPEGLTWCAHEAASVSLSGTGLATLPLRDIGPWQRLRFAVEGAASVRAIVYLTLKG